MSKNNRYLFLLIPIAIGIMVLGSCKKKTPENIGLPYLPAGDLLNATFTDTFTLITHSCKSDSLMTNRMAPILLGTMNDPFFGITTASIFTQLEPARYNPTFGSGITLDSVVLSLPFYGNKYYGSLAAETFEVYKLTDTLNYATNYYSNKSKAYSTLLGSVYIQPNVTDRVHIGSDTVTLPPQLRLKLDTGYFQNFFDSTQYTNYNTFQNFFNGLYITANSIPASGSGAILYIDLTNTLYSHLTLYFRSSIKPLPSGPLGADTSFTLNVNSATCAHFSHFVHDYSATTVPSTGPANANINDQLTVYSDTMIQEDQVYVQPMAGVRTKITFPSLKHFFDDGEKAINKAELILKVDPSSIAGANSIFAPHPQLVIAISDPIGPLVMPDYYEGVSYFGGTYDATNHQYIFNIARYVQQVITGKRKNEGLYIMTTSSSTIANRVQLIGGNKLLSGHMRLKITYTPLK
ncbi:MAG: DUF4270 domain-containing protein [Bacteroidetes bacterium]|nr:DUF4270 domain-containing protein [Bacteroidota bacterium]